MKALPLFGVRERARRTLDARPAWFRRGVIPALTALTLCGIAGSDPELARGLTPRTLTVEAPPVPPAPAESVAAARGPYANARGSENDALVGAVSRKYRVSRGAAREFVAMAYHEGWRIGVDPVLLVAVMAVESGFNPVAESDGGAVGLMQVIPRFHEDKLAAAGGVSALEPRMNIQLGARVLKEYIQRGGTEVAGLQLYNGAAGDATNAYATRVLREKQRLEDAIRRGANTRASADKHTETRAGA